MGSHQTPEVNYLDRFKIREIPCRLKSKISVCRVNHHSETGVDSSLHVSGGCTPHTYLTEWIYSIVLNLVSMARWEAVGGSDPNQVRGKDPLSLIPAMDFSVRLHL